MQPEMFGMHPSQHARQIKIPDTLGGGNFNHWIFQVRDAVMAASGHALGVWEWILQVTERGASMESLADPSPFPALDALLMCAIGQTIRGEIERLIYTARERVFSNAIANRSLDVRPC